MEQITLPSALDSLRRHGILLPSAVNLIGNKCRENKLLSWGYVAGGIRPLGEAQDHGRFRPLSSSEWADLLKSETNANGELKYEDSKLTVDGSWLEDNVTIIRKPHPEPRYDGERWQIVKTRREVIHIKGLRFDRTQFSEMLLSLKSNEPAPNGICQSKTTIVKRGRKPGTGYQRSDAALVVEGIALVREGKAKSGTEAAGMLADRAEGASENAKITRLAAQINAGLHNPE